MKTYNTALGPVEITHADMRSAGRGQFQILVDIKFDGEHKTLKTYSTNSVMYDDLQDADNATEYLLNEYSHEIESVVDDYINSL